MARVQDGGFRPAELDRASLGRDGEMNLQPSKVGVEQVVDSLCARHPLMEDKLARARTPGSIGEDLIGEEETTVVKIPKRAHAVILGIRAKAYMAEKEGTWLEDVKSLMSADCGASTTVTTSLANTTDLVERHL